VLATEEESVPWRGNERKRSQGSKKPIGGLAAVSRRARFREHHGFGRFNFPFKSAEYTVPASVDYSKVEVSNTR